MTHLYRLLVSLIVLTAGQASAELPLNVQNEWRGMRNKLARTLVPELRVAMTDPDAAEARLTGVLLKLVRMDVEVEKLDRFVGHHILEFVVHGGLTDAVERVQPESAVERQNVNRYLVMLSAQANYGAGFVMNATLQKAIRRQNRRRYALAALALATPIPYDILMTKLGLYWIPGTSLPLLGFVAAAVTLPFVGRAVPIGKKFPSSHLGVQFAGCDARLGRRQDDLRDVTPERDHESSRHEFARFLRVTTRVHSILK